jgi:sRNA-binding carbon storage regulator CsrA
MNFRYKAELHVRVVKAEEGGVDIRFDAPVSFMILTREGAEELAKAILRSCGWTQDWAATKS